MFFLRHKITNARRQTRERRSGSRRRRGDTKLRIRTGFRDAILGSLYLRQGKDHAPLSKIEWLDTLVISTAIEASKYNYADRNGRTVDWRSALERTGELAWDLHRSQKAKEPRIYSTIEGVARMTESTLDFLLARCRVSQIDRRVSTERRG